MSTTVPSWPSAATAPPSRDRAARSELRDFVTTLIGVVASAPDDHRLLRSLVLDFPARFRASAAMLARTQADGSLVAVSRFGHLPRAADGPAFGTGDDGPAQRAARGTAPYVLATADESRVAHQRESDHAAPVAAVRLGSHRATVGVVLLRFDADILDLEDLDDLLVVLRDVVSLHTRTAWQEPLPAPVSRHLLGTDVVDGDTALTQRRLDVLRLMSTGLSNRAIAQRIGYSESTVRHETMAIYRILGVGDRHTASLVGRTRGLIG